MRRLWSLNIAILFGLSTITNSMRGQEVSILEKPINANESATEVGRQEPRQGSSPSHQATAAVAGVEELPAPQSESAADESPRSDGQLDDKLKSILEPSESDFLVPTPTEAATPSATSASAVLPRARVAPPTPRPLESPSGASAGQADVEGRTAQPPATRPQVPQTGRSPTNSAPSRLNQAAQALQAANVSRTATRPALPAAGSPANVLSVPLGPVPVMVVGGRFGRALAIPAPPFPAAPIAPPFMAGRNLASPPFVGGRGLFRRR